MCLATTTATTAAATTPGAAGRMDQGCAYGAVPILMTFAGDILHVETAELACESRCWRLALAQPHAEPHLSASCTWLLVRLGCRLQVIDIDIDCPIDCYPMTCNNWYCCLPSKPLLTPLDCVMLRQCLLRPLPRLGHLHLVLVDLRATKSTTAILTALQSAYPTPSNVGRRSRYARI